jgi:Sec-independent protein secretion pathway component TatC
MLPTVLLYEASILIVDRIVASRKAREAKEAAKTDA